MNRLWVRLSMVMSGLILLFTVLPLFAFLIFPRQEVKNDRIDSRRPGFNALFLIRGTICRKTCCVALG